jgi:hypothetical protein
VLGAVLTSQVCLRLLPGCPVQNTRKHSHGPPVADRPTDRPTDRPADGITAWLIE